MRKGIVLAVIAGLAVLGAVGAGVYVVVWSGSVPPSPPSPPPPPVSADPPGGDADSSAAAPDPSAHDGAGSGSAALDQALESARRTLSSVRDPAAPDGGTDSGAQTGLQRPADGPPASTTSPPRPDSGTGTGSASRSAMDDPPAPRIESSGTASDPAAPTFDVVRVEPDGSAVMAGRAEPGSTVTLLDAGTAIGQSTADARGQWVILPDAPLNPGDRALSLRATGSGGTVAGDGDGDGAARRSENIVVLSLPEPDGTAPVLALEAPRAGGGTAEVLQGPTAAMASGALTLSQVDYTSGGEVALTGSAAPGSVVQLYLDNAPVARAEVGESGRWQVVPEAAGLTDTADDGVATLRVDELDASGAVTDRVEVPFQRADLSILEGADADTLVVVQPGNNLWTVARAVYGRGIDYTIIYRANAGQIRDPDLIYPGQVFRIPTEDDASAAAQ